MSLMWLAQSGRYWRVTTAEILGESTPDLGAIARLGRLRELNSRLQKLVATEETFPFEARDVTRLDLRVE